MTTIRLSPKDNVVTAAAPLEVGSTAERVTVRTLIPRGHKMATAAIPKGAPVFKYAQIIGYAGEDIAPGSHVHTHNLEFRAVAHDHAFA